MKKPAYQALARKHRPQSFDEVVGQDAASQTLKNAVSSGRVAHAYLFTGPRGVGKTTMARILAKALDCATGPTPEPCGQCDPCREIAASSCLDVLEMDAASHTGVDNVRQVIIETVGLAPSRDRYKVFIIDEAHMLSTAAFNALLKTLEEPPPHAVFILATTEAAKIPPTIASRCQRFRFRPIALETLLAHLEELSRREKIGVEPGALELLARCAEGSLRDAVSLLDQSRSFGEGRITEGLVRDMFGFAPQDLLLSLGKALGAGDPASLAKGLKASYEQGVEPGQLLRDLRAGLEGVYLERLGLAGSCDKAWGIALAGSSADGLAFLLRRVNRALEELRFGDSPRLILELGLFGCLEAAGDLASWVERLERLEGRLQAGAPPPRSISRGQEPEGAPCPEPAARPFSGGAPDAAWAAAIEAIRREKAALAATLERARLAPSAEGPWRLVFGKAFDADLARRSLPVIEAKLATLAGRQVRILVETGDVGQIGHTRPPAKAAQAPEEGGWQDVSEAPPPAAQASEGLRKAQDILGGKVRVVKKPAP